jgi:hypothetical protein
MVQFREIKSRETMNETREDLDNGVLLHAGKWDFFRSWRYLGENEIKKIFFVHF